MLKQLKTFKLLHIFIKLSVNYILVILYQKEEIHKINSSNGN